MPQTVDWCFLVGGPGDGKSEALGELAGALRVSRPEKVPEPEAREHCLKYGPTQQHP